MRLLRAVRVATVTSHSGTISDSILKTEGMSAKPKDTFGGSRLFHSLNVEAEKRSGVKGDDR